MGRFQVEALSKIVELMLLNAILSYWGVPERKTAQFPFCGHCDLIFQYTKFSLRKHRREAVSPARGRWQGKKGQRTGGDRLSLDQTELISASERKPSLLG